MSTKRKFTKVICGLVLLQGLLLSLGAEETQDEKILFLHLKITNNVISVVESTAVPGHLKVPIAAEKQGDLYLELISTNSSVPIWTDVMSDPLVHRYEYEDPDHPGQLKVKEVKVDQADFTIRIPGRKEAKQLNIYRLNQPAAKSAAAASNQTRTLLGTVELRLSEAAR
ncbi:MAG: hypothetical protein ABSE97_00590 [Verrucomicrobiota bacterium]